MIAGRYTDTTAGWYLGAWGNVGWTNPHIQSHGEDRCMCEIKRDFWMWLQIIFTDMWPDDQKISTTEKSMSDKEADYG